MPQYNASSAGGKAGRLSIWLAVQSISYMPCGRSGRPVNWLEEQVSISNVLGNAGRLVRLLIRTFKIRKFGGNSFSVVIALLLARSSTKPVKYSTPLRSVMPAQHIGRTARFNTSAWVVSSTLPFMAAGTKFWNFATRAGSGTTNCACAWCTVIISRMQLVKVALIMFIMFKVDDVTRSTPNKLPTTCSLRTSVHSGVPVESSYLRQTRK